MGRKKRVNVELQHDFESKEVGQRIKKILQEKRITQKALAEKLNYTSVTISRWLNGERGIGIPQLKAIGKILDVDVDYLLGNANNPHHEQELNNKFDNCMHLEETDFYSNYDSLISYLKTIGYDVEVIGGSGSSDSSDTVYVHIDIGILKNGKTIAQFSSHDWIIFSGRLKKIIELELNDF